MAEKQELVHVAGSVLASTDPATRQARLANAGWCRPKHREPVQRGGSGVSAMRGWRSEAPMPSIVA